jgi:hypothetical protein
MIDLARKTVIVRCILAGRAYEPHNGEEKRYIGLLKKKGSDFQYSEFEKLSVQLESKLLGSALGERPPEEIPGGRCERFSAEPDRLLLYSERSCFVCPSADREIRQSLSLHADGRVFFSRYYCPADGEVKKLRRTNGKLRLKRETAAGLTAQASRLLRRAEPEAAVCDGDLWRAVLTGADGEPFRACGTMERRSAFSTLSVEMRRALNRPELWLFDGRAAP